MTIGESLKRARKKMGLELDDVARATKIAKMFLIALENDDISSLPQGVYARNFLRTYARFLKLDEDILTTEYHEQYAIKPQFVTQHEQTKLDNQRFVKRRNRMLVLVLLLVGLVIVLSILFWQFWPIISADTQAAPASPASVEKTLGQSSEERLKTQVEEPAPANLGVDQLGTSQLAEQMPQAEPLSTMATASNTPPGHESAIPTKINTPGPSASPDPVDLPDLQVPLPLKNLAALLILPRGAERLEDTFVVAALTEAVRLRVVIDGIIVSDLNLKPGNVRVYSYGVNNSVSISNIAKVAVQDGLKFRARAGKQATSVKLENFAAHAFFTALDDYLKTQAKSDTGGDAQ